MDTFWLLLVQWLHILGGIVWFGGFAFMTFALWPALLQRPAPEARALFQALGRPIGALMGASAQLVLWLGLLRGIWLGPVRSFAFVVETGYGRTFGVALLLTLVVIGYGIASGRGLEERLWDGDTWRPGAARAVRRSNLVIFVLLCAVVACMVLMRFGR